GPTIIGAGRTFIGANVGSLGAASPLGADTSAIRIVSTTDGATDPNSGRYGTGNSVLALSVPNGAITIDRAIVIDGVQTTFNDAQGAVLQGNGSLSSMTFNGGLALNNSKVLVTSDGTTTFNGVISGN